ncbi:MAG: 23S rRNA pseudouridine(955/2504/2580) synthase RluC [Gammaproteobacteria bacterium]|nr:23S rRNA pseudouridine(955/2504/2580) synthase RluC [Gammaproteobacteria bacterium]
MNKNSPRHPTPPRKLPPTPPTVTATARPRSGVSEAIIDAASDGQRLDNFLIKQLKGVPKSHIYRIVRKGEVRINGGRSAINQRLNSGDRVRIPPIRLAESNTPTPSSAQLQQLRRAIIFEDERFLFINKPSGMAVHGGSGISFGVIEGLRQLRPDAPFLELGHRLDRDTSGVLVIAKRRSALRGFQEELTSGRCDKRYIPLLRGRWQGGERRINVPLLKYQQSSGERIVTVSPEGKNALSLFIPQQRFTNATLMEVKLITGRTHQVRVHAQHCDHPIAGDERYGDREFNRSMAELGLKRLFLHAQSIRFTLPEIMTYDIIAPLDNTLEQILPQLEPLA